MKPFRIGMLGCLLLRAGAAYGQTADELAATKPLVNVVVLDRETRPLGGVRVEIRAGAEVVTAGETDSTGQVAFPQLKPGRYAISASKDGFESLRKSDIDLSQAAASSVEITLVQALNQHEQIEVHDTADPLQQGVATSTQMSGRLAMELPRRPEKVTDALPLIPGVVRTPAGDLQISGTGDHRSALIVNSADVTDPATGQFGLTVPIDSVETLSVFQTPFLAEYGRFSAGLVSVETRRGGDVWKWELNDPFPDIRVRSYHLRGLRDATPRVNVEGPIVAGKLYFSEGLEYEVRNIEVHSLPFPFNQTKKTGVNSFAQFDWVASRRQLVTATIHVAPQRMSFVNLDYFDPQPTTPNASTHNYTGTISDRLTLLGGLLENTFSVTRFDARIWGQGTADLNITPVGNTGNYFAQQDRDASRIGWSPSYTVAPWNRFGTHSFKVGSYLAKSSDNGEVQEHPVNIQDTNHQLMERIAFFGGRPFQMSDTEYAFFGQDHWSISSRLAADLGVRTESQVISHAFRVAPRAGLAWVPFANTGTVVRAGFGLFFDRVPLNVYAFNHYPKQVVTLFDAEGGISAGPFFYLNALGQVNTRQPFVLNRMVAGNFSPRTATGSIQVEQTVTRLLKVRVGYLRSISDGLVTMITQTPDPETMLGVHQLSGSGNGRYRQFEITTRLKVTEKHELFFSYVRNRAHGELNDFSSFLGSFPQSLIRPNTYGRIPGDLPNRFLAWGTVPLPKGFRLAPIFEFRDGFSYFDTDASQNYVGIPGRERFPSFVSLDSRFTKDLKVNSKYTLRVGIAGYNLTNHFNPEVHHGNIADPAYGLFYGSRGRRFTADFDVLF